MHAIPFLWKVHTLTKLNAPNLEAGEVVQSFEMYY